MTPRRPNEQNPGVEAEFAKDVAAFASTRGGLIVYCRAGQWWRGWRFGQGIPYSGRRQA